MVIVVYCGTSSGYKYFENSIVYRKWVIVEFSIVSTINNKKCLKENRNYRYDWISEY